MLALNDSPHDLLIGRIIAVFLSSIALLFFAAYAIDIWHYDDSVLYVAGSGDSRSNSMPMDTKNYSADSLDASGESSIASNGDGKSGDSAKTSSYDNSSSNGYYGRRFSNDVDHSDRSIAYGEFSFFSKLFDCMQFILRIFGISLILPLLLLCRCAFYSWRGRYRCGIPAVIYTIVTTICSVIVISTFIGTFSIHVIDDFNPNISRYSGILGYFLASELLWSFQLHDIAHEYISSLGILRIAGVTLISISLFLLALSIGLIKISINIGIFDRIIKWSRKSNDKAMNNSDIMHRSIVYSERRLDGDERDNVANEALSDKVMKSGDFSIPILNKARNIVSSERLDDKLDSDSDGKSLGRDTRDSCFDASIQPFRLPSVSLIGDDASRDRGAVNATSLDVLQGRAELLMKVLNDFGIFGEIVGIREGPVVTLYEVEPAAGTKSSRIINLADDIARSMSVLSTRISVIPGKNAIGIEVPNVHRQTVYLSDLLNSEEYQNTDCALPIILGQNIMGDIVVGDLAKMPHLLVAGTTGSGKSVAVNAMILSLLYRYTPEQCRFVMIDPKMLELSTYQGIAHLLTPVVTDPKKAVLALKWVIKEMESRYQTMSLLGVRNIMGYNNFMQNAIDQNIDIERDVQTGFDVDSGKPLFHTISVKREKLPYIVVIVDEMADLMLVAGKDIESCIQRIAQMARAAGIHLIMATQRPSVDVITGVIKANFPTRISFQVTSKIDSRTILGDVGAEQLLGMGDMLYMIPGGKIERVHGPFISDADTTKVTDFFRSNWPAKYIDDLRESIDIADRDGDIMNNRREDGDGDDDGGGDLYRDAVKIVLQDKRPTTSYLQRRLKIGYNRAASLIERMEEEGIISAPNATGKREIIAEVD